MEAEKLSRWQEIIRAKGCSTEGINKSSGFQGWFNHPSTTLEPPFQPFLNHPSTTLPTKCQLFVFVFIFIFKYKYTPHTPGLSLRSCPWF